VRKANLRLDKEDSTFEVRKGKSAVVRGKAEQSEMVRRIFSKDPDEVMPPPDSNRALTAGQQDLLSSGSRAARSGASTGRSSRPCGPSCRR
jgi:hypothetical protein